MSTRTLVWAGVLAIVLPILTLTTHFTSGTELARVRNALIFDAHKPQNFDWTPATRPSDFLVDETPVDPYFAAVAERLHLAALPSDWDRAKAIASHLLSSHPPLMGGAVQSNLTGTYEAMVGEGRGYCADFVLVFRAIASAAGVPVRAWAFSFDGFGGHGHVVPEIWDRATGRWYVLDIYNNNYFLRAGSSVPLSASEFRKALLESPSQLRLLRIEPQQPPGYVSDEKVLAYYRRGLPEWYLWWGNNPFTYEGGVALPMDAPGFPPGGAARGHRQRRATADPSAGDARQPTADRIDGIPRAACQAGRAVRARSASACLATALVSGRKRSTSAALPIPVREC